VRDFSTDPVPRSLIELAIRAASTAPSGAHRQPWTFVAISNPSLKRQIREAAEAEERAFYATRAPDAWLEALAPLGTTWEKPHLERAPWLVVLFAQRSGLTPQGEPVKHYYVTESCGIAAGLFVAALHEIGLCTLTHTPSPMGFLSQLLGLVLSLPDHLLDDRGGLLVKPNPPDSFGIDGEVEWGPTVESLPSPPEFLQYLREAGIGPIQPLGKLLERDPSAGFP
jgi:nitroreductase